MSRAAHQEPATRGRELRVGRARLEIKIDPAAAPSQLFAFESTLPPGGGMPYLHLHHEMEEAFYVLEGTIEYTRGDQTILAAAGSMVQISPGVAHKFRNVGTAQARHLAVITPGMAGLRVMEAVAQADFSDAQAVAEELRRHNSEILGAGPSPG
jgi:quercetin dioxygenase-like cupin family protein